MLLSILAAQATSVQAEQPNFSQSLPVVWGISGDPAANTKQLYHRSQLPSNRDYHVFGESGRPGRNGRSGAAGNSGRSVSIQLNDESPVQTLEYDLSGQDGSDGNHGQPGEPARACGVPHQPAYSLRGASGGDGGNGGQGGDGGDGGDASIFYADTDSLKHIVVDASGGRGGQPGDGAGGGEGCDCIEPQWTVNYCEWELWRRPINDENADWAIASSGLAACTGVQNVDERENVPSVDMPYPDTYRYQLHYRGIATTRQFFCQNGEQGAPGRNGRPGASGHYGQLRLIPRPTIPDEMVHYSDSLQNLLGQSIELVKNIWVQRQGLSDLLHPSSDIPNDYTYLKSTERPRFRLEWAAEETPEELGIGMLEIATSVRVENEQARLTYEIPGTVDYTISRQADVEIVTVTGGFFPDRLGQFELADMTNGVEESELVFVDQGALRELLETTTIAVSCFTKQSASGVASDNYQFRHSVDFEVSRRGVFSNKLALSGNEYILTLGQVFSPWLKSGYDVMYVIEFRQTTNSGATYSQTEEIEFRV
jgi:hypothetical protein